MKASETNGKIPENRVFPEGYPQISWKALPLPSPVNQCSQIQNRLTPER